MARLWAIVRMLVSMAAGVIATAAVGANAAEASAEQRLLARLSEDQQRVYMAWREARQVFNRQHDAYWAEVAGRRTERRRKMAGGIAVTQADFVMQQPPRYQGPALRPDIAKIQAEVADPPSPDSEITTLPEMLAAAKSIYRFEPSIIPEREFKRRYAIEALAAGLTKDEVTRIYAFETGGRGTFDMQAGINPETKAGRAISTAMGYAQLLAANSIDELTRSGDGFISRLSMMAARPGTPPARVRELTAKIDALRAMLRAARSVPKEWSRHVELARTPPGFAIHVLNLDGDIGPWLQVIKLKGIKNTAEAAGLTRATPAELELMNLSGPRTGLEMMSPAGRAAPTANFFSQAAYYRNTIVREKVGAELLAAIDQRMTENMVRSGSQEFAAVFDEVLAGRLSPAVAAEQRQQLLPAAARPSHGRPAPVAPMPVAPSPARSDAYRPPSAPTSSSGLPPPSAAGLPLPSAPMSQVRMAPSGDARPRAARPPETMRPTGFPD